ncbi:hypothetical protein B0H16DRAFT_347580 [Mycena metata]|uniref:Uncharacterized protein n=1 Tax=Mycena metata TaxID=1033252 RepID=A0AAD7HLD3_9AGAR|nr:hypothetical protein B0H16DRAFT_347580 [Mycena metata]
MAEIALINLDKGEVVDASETGHGFKMSEAIANYMPMDALWLFTVPVDSKVPPTPSVGDNSFAFRGTKGPARVPVGHWAGDRVVIVDEYCGSAADNFPSDMLEKYPDADPEEDALEFALAHLTHVGLPGYKHGNAGDALFPAGRAWVVRNLTNNWYARADTLVPTKYRCGPDSTEGAPGLGDFIWGQIGGSIAGTDCPGERFDVQTEAALEDGQWVDLSKQKKAFLAESNMHDDIDALRGGGFDDDEEED